MFIFLIDGWRRQEREKKGVVQTRERLGEMVLFLVFWLMIPLLSICLSIICKCKGCVKSRLENTGHDSNSCALPRVFEMALNRAETVSPSRRLSIVCVRGWDRPHRPQDVCRSVAPPEVHHSRPSAPVALQWSRLLPRACTEPAPNQPADRPSVANHHCQPLRIRLFSLRLETGETHRR